MISEAAHIELLAGERELTGTNPAVSVLRTLTFTLLLVLLAFTAVPYGTVEFWWKGFFVSCTFGLLILCVLEAYLSGSWRSGGEPVLMPILALSILTFLQAIPFGYSTGAAGIALPVAKTISADPFATKFFLLQLLALMFAGAMLFRYTASERRLRTLVHVLIGVVLVSALFGILRQTMQRKVGFGLPLIKPDQGYGQFINRNHFAFLMEMGLGLTLGMIIGRGVKRDQAIVYVGALLPIWAALVLSNSRGGLLAMLVQVISAVLLFSYLASRRGSETEEPRSFRLARSFPARVVMLFVLLGGVFLGTLWLGGDRLASRLEEGREVDPAADARVNSNRNRIWGATWQAFKANPLAGVGMGGYWAAIPTYHDASGSMTPQEAHNDYLELLASGGLIGFALGVWFIVIVVRRLRINLDQGSGFRRAACFGATLGLIGVAVHSLVDFGLHMIVNALAFTALVVIATSVPRASHTNDE